LIANLQFYQQNPYNFSAVEPIFSFLLELPSNNEKDLYNLSLRLETRKMSKIIGDDEGTLKIKRKESLLTKSKK